MPPFPPTQPPSFAQVANASDPAVGYPPWPPPPPHPATLSTPVADFARPLAAEAKPVRIAFGPTSPTRTSWRPVSPTKAVQHMFDQSSSPSLRSEPPRGPRGAASPPRPAVPGQQSSTDTYLERIAASERQYSAHLSSIAPYIQAAFNQWFAQGTSPPLQAFLVHYFGREPTGNELGQLERLLDLRTRTSRDQEEWRDLYERSLLGQRSQAETPNSASNVPLSTSRWTPSAPATAVPTGPRAETGDGRSSVAPPLPTAGTSSNAQSHSQATAAAPMTASPTTNPAAPGSMELSKPRGPFNASGEMYEKLSHVGEGTYGKVYKARSNDDGSFVALKRIRMEGEKDGFPVTAMREIKLLQALRHGNVIRLHEIMVSKGSVHMVFEYMDHDLTGLLAHPTLTFSPANIKSLSYQMLAGLSYLHDKAILHRDMKGSNILLNSKGELKLADFGLARLYSKRHRDDYTNRVITLWYRSPELLMGETVYGPEVDMWSAGCIVLEIFTTKPIFQGNDEIHQLEVIYSIMGTPRESDWPNVTDLPWYELVKPKEVLPSKFRSSFAKWLSPAALELVEGLLHFDPSQRLLADQAMTTAYFTTEEPAMEVPTQLAGMGEHHEMDAKQERHRRRMEGR